MKSGNILGGKYRLVQKIGKGAMGEVWAAQNEQTGLAVALKVIIPTAPEHRTLDLRHRLIRESNACRKLSHRNIVQILDMGTTDDGDPFLVLELLQGQTLEDRLNDTRRIEPAEAARIGIEIADALTAAHDAMIIHRDLKPANIFLHRQGDRYIVKVLDFGVSKHLEGGEGPATATNTAVGSPAYMSPEQVATRKDLDGRSDIWSLGVVLYEMLAGARPFVGTVSEVVRQIALSHINKVPPPSTKVRSVPPELDEIVARCMQADREARYATAADVARALASVAEMSRSIRIPTSLSLLTAGNLPTATAPVEPQPTLTTPAPAAATSPEVPSSSDAATQPLQPAMLAGMHTARENAAPKPALGATGTQVMAGNQPVASPSPAWKQEMNEWRAQRQSSTGTETPVSDDAAHGGTQALDPEVVMGATATADRASTTTSAIGALSTGSHPAVSPTSSQDVVGAKPRRKRSSRLFFVMMAVGIAAALAVVVILLLSASPADRNADVDGPGASAHPAASAIAPAEPKSVAPPTQPATAPIAPPPSEPPLPGSTATSGTAPPTAPTTQPKAPTAPPKAPTAPPAVKTWSPSEWSPVPAKPAPTPTQPGVVPLCKQGGKLVKCPPRMFN